MCATITQMKQKVFSAFISAYSTGLLLFLVIKFYALCINLDKVPTRLDVFL